MFNIALREDKNLFLVTIGGKVTPTEGEEFLKILKEKIKNISTNEYDLVIEINSIKVTSIKMMLILSEIINIYKATNFKRIFSIVENKKIGEDFVEKFQAQIGRTVILCESLEEILKNY